MDRAHAIARRAAPLADRLTAYAIGAALGLVLNLAAQFIAQVMT